MHVHVKIKNAFHAGCIGEQRNGDQKSERHEKVFAEAHKTGAL